MSDIRHYRITAYNLKDESLGSIVVSTNKMPSHERIVHYLNMYWPDRPAGGYYTMETLSDKELELHIKNNGREP
jgi:hypothetical protein